MKLRILEARPSNGIVIGREMARILVGEAWQFWLNYVWQSVVKLINWFWRRKNYAKSQKALHRQRHINANIK